MNFKKFISGVSAFAIAASAFAGMAMTASATTSTGTVTPSGDTVTVSGISPVIDAVFKKDTATDATSEEMYFGKWYVGSGNYGSFALAKFDVKSYLDQYSENYVLASASLNLMSKYQEKTGTIDVSLANKVADDWDETLTIDAVKALYGNAAPSTINSQGMAASYTNKAFDVTSAFSTDTDGVLTFGMTTNNDGRKVYVASNENATMAGPTLTLTFKEKVTVNANVVAKCGDVELSSTSISGYAGTSYSYAPYAYINKDGVYYKYDAIGSNGEVNTISGTLSAGMADIELSYSKADAVVYYTEVSAHNYQGHSEFAGPGANTIASGGVDGGTVYGQSGARCYQEFSVAKAGTYNITVNAAGVASGDRMCYLTVDSTDTADSLATLASSGAAAKQTVSVHLTAGDHTFYYLSSGSISPKLDYMVVELVSEDVPADKGTVVADASYTEDGSDSVATFRFTVTPNDETVTTITVTADGSNETSRTLQTPKITDGVFNCAIIATYTGATAPDANAFHVSIN